MALVKVDDYMLKKASEYVHKDLDERKISTLLYNLKRFDDGKISIKELYHNVLPDRWIGILDTTPFVSLLLYSGGIDPLVEIDEVPQKFLRDTLVESIIIPQCVKTIKSKAFFGCPLLEEVIIPDGVTSIEDDAFNYCPNLTQVTLPSSVKNIGEFAFYSETPKNIKYLGTLEQWHSVDYTYKQFTSFKSGTIIHCADGDYRIF